MQGQFYKPLSLSLIYDRTAIKRESYLAMFLFAFLLSYMMDEVLGQLFGLSQYTICGLAGIGGLAVLGCLIINDTFFRKWQLFYLEPSECLFAYRGEEPILVTSTEAIRQGVLEGCHKITLISNRPWFNRKIEIMIGGAAFHFSASLKLSPKNARGVREWLNFEEEDVINEIKSCSSTIARSIGIGVALESPREFTSMIEQKFNSSLLGELGFTLSLSWPEEKTLSEIAVLQ